MSQDFTFLVRGERREPLTLRWRGPCEGGVTGEGWGGGGFILSI